MPFFKLCSLYTLTILPTFLATQTPFTYMSSRILTNLIFNKLICPVSETLLLEEEEENRELPEGEVGRNREIMGRRVFICLVFIQLTNLLLCPVAKHVHNNIHQKEGEMQHFTSISTQQKDITTPIITIPTNPITTTVSNPDSTSATNPMTPPATTAGASWCVASQSSAEFALQIALDYACGYGGGADCSAIQPNGNCFMPDTLRNHASFAFNNYYQKNPVPTSCDFGGTAVKTNTNPSHGSCQYPPTSTSSSVLNTTNSIGSRIYGAGPITPSASVANKSFRGLLHLQFFVFLFMFLEKILIHQSILSMILQEKYG